MIQVYALKAFKEALKGVIRDVRVAWLLEEMSLPYERIVMDATQGENKTPEYLKLNPTGKVPTLVDGDMVLFESAAICEYLTDKYKKFMPVVGSQDYYLVKQWSYFVLTNLDPLASRVFGCDFFFEQNSTTQHIRQLAVEQVMRFLKVLDERLQESEYLVGNTITLADIYLTCALGSLRHTNMVHDYRNLRAHYEKCTSRPAFQTAFARNGI